MMTHSLRPSAGRVILTLITALTLGGNAIAKNEDSLGDDPRVQDAVTLWSEWMEYQAALAQVPGVSWGIVHDQELLASGAFGAANPQGNVPATTDTLYSICSISKLFTSIALMQQREAGKVRLDDPVETHLDWYNIDNAYPDAEPVTIRGLLTHSAGLPRESDYPYWTDPDHTFPTSDEIRAKLGEQQTLYPASRYFQYSNLGLSLVGEIVAAVSGQAYDVYMREQLLDPLGMADTSTDIPVELHGGRLAVGHSSMNRDGTRDVIPPFQARGIAPAAGYASSVNDMARFAQWQFRVLNGEDKALLSQASLQEMQRVQWVDPDWESSWGLGFNVEKDGDRIYASHGGGCPGYYTQFRLEPKTRIGFIVLTNTIGSSPGTWARRGFEVVGPVITEAVRQSGEAPARDGSLEAYTGIYQSIWDQVVITPWKDGLAFMELEVSDPARAIKYFQPAGEHTFRLVREDDGSPGETMEFELDEQGMAHRFKRHSIWRERLVEP